MGQRELSHTQLFVSLRFGLVGFAPHPWLDCQPLNTRKENHVAFRLSAKGTQASLLITLCAGACACTTSSSAQTKKPNFEGAWSVEWCDKSRPHTDCGGFNLDLVQSGSALCGSYDSARVGLSQIDEGGRVSGTANGGSAVLTVESERSGGKYAVQAVLIGNQLHWKLGQTIRPADRDIDIIAIDEKLSRRQLDGELGARHAETASDCRAQGTRPSFPDSHTDYQVADIR